MDVQKTIEFILEQQAHIAVIQAQAEEQAKERAAKHAAEIARLDQRLRRAIRLAVQEARHERKLRREMDARFDLKMDQIAAAHLLTEETVKRLSEKIDRFVDASLHPGNGHPQ